MLFVVLIGVIGMVVGEIIFIVFFICFCLGKGVSLGVLVYGAGMVKVY